MTVHRVVRNCTALSKREFSSGFTGSFVLAPSYQNPPPCGNKNSYDKPLRFGVVQAMVITLSDTSKLKRLQTRTRANSFTFSLGLFILGKRRGCSNSSLERAFQVDRQRRGFALPSACVGSISIVPGC